MLGNVLLDKSHSLYFDSVASSQGFEPHDHGGSVIEELVKQTLSTVFEHNIYDWNVVPCVDGTPIKVFLFWLSPFWGGQEKKKKFITLKLDETKMSKKQHWLKTRKAAK